MTTALPIPKPGESEFDFTTRAHKDLAGKVDNYFDRNEMVWKQWDKYCKTPDRTTVVADRLLGDRYVDAGPPVAYFTEHETLAPDGSPRKYGLKDLIGIASQQNHNVVERGRFAAISDDHTVDDPQGKQPAILGYATRYRLGQLGFDHPVWAIFAHERVAKDNVQRFHSLPRRSVELLTDRRTGQRLFDPIAALGSKAPRLSMPGRYEVDGDIERYSFAGAYPGGGNTRLEQFSHEGNMELSDEALRQIVEAIKSLPELQWVSTQMAGGGAPIAPPAGAAIGPAPGMPGDPMAGGMPPPDAMGGSPDAAGMGPPPGDSAPPDDDDQNQYSFFGGNSVDVERYAQLQKTVGDLQTVIQKQADQIATLANSRADATRQVRLAELEAKYQGFISSSEEVEKCLYSHGSKMDDAAFDAYCQNIERFAARAQVTSVGALPAGVQNQSPPEVDRYSDKFREIASVAIERHTADLEAGRQVKTFEEYVAEIKAGK